MKSKMNSKRPLHAAVVLLAVVMAGCESDGYGGYDSHVSVGVGYGYYPGGYYPGYYPGYGCCWDNDVIIVNPTGPARRSAGGAGSPDDVAGGPGQPAVDAASPIDPAGSSNPATAIPPGPTVRGKVKG